jgi:hypothetical protein
MDEKRRLVGPAFPHKPGHNAPTGPVSGVLLVRGIFGAGLATLEWALFGFAHTMMFPWAILRINTISEVVCAENRGLSRDSIPCVFRTAPWQGAVIMKGNLGIPGPLAAPPSIPAPRRCCHAWASASPPSWIPSSTEIACATWRPTTVPASSPSACSPTVRAPACEPCLCWQDGEFQDNVEYSLSGTPCQTVLDARQQYVPEKVQILYPRDEYLAVKGVESYFGVPLGEPYSNGPGLISILDTRPMSLSMEQQSVLRVFATRIARELAWKRPGEQPARRSWNGDRAAGTDLGVCLPRAEWPV